MKKIVLFILIHLWSFSYLAQPTGNTRFYLEVLDISKKDTFSIFQSISKLRKSKTRVKSNRFQLIDVSKHATGFEKRNGALYLNKNIFEKRSQFLIIHNKKDTMSLTISDLNFSCYLKVNYQVGNFFIDLKQKPNNSSIYIKVNSNNFQVKDISNYPLQPILSSKPLVSIVENDKSSKLISTQESKKENPTKIKQKENPFTLLSEKVSSNYIYQLGFCTIENFKQSQQEIKHGENSFFNEIKFRIRDKKSQELIFEELITRDNNFPKKEENYFDLFPINFDSIEDVKISSNNSIHYILSYKNDEKTILFYTEKFLKNCKEFNRNEVEKKLTLEESDYQLNQRKTIEFSGIQFDTIRIFSQTTNKPIYTQEFTFLNYFDRGRPRQIGERKNLPPRLKKEIADYNGDGAVDYRIEEGVRIESNWNYFIWDKKKNIYVFDSLLSSMSTTFLSSEKKLVGEKYDSKNGARIYSNYEFINQNFTVVKRKECVSIHDQSEKSVCNIYKLDHGKLVLVESYTTAE